MKHINLFDDIPNNLISATIDRWIKGIKYRQVLKDKLIDKLTFEQVAEKNDLSTRYVKTIVYRYEMIIFEHLGL